MLFGQAIRRKRFGRIMVDGMALAFSNIVAMDIGDAVHATEIAVASDPRRDARAVAVLELRPATYLVLVLDVLDEPLVRAVGRLAEDVEALRDAFVAGLRSGHQDVVDFATEVNAAEWGHESVLQVLSRMQSVVNR